MKALNYYIVYKPFQVLTQFSASENKQTLKHFFDVPRDVYPVGRLDYDSEGLLILTNDTALNKRLLHPAHAHERTYYAQAEGLIDEEALQALRRGITINIDGRPYRTRPCKALWLSNAPAVPVRNPPIRFRRHIPTSWVSLTLTEGKNRQVRRMLAAAGFPVLRLIRCRIAGIDVGNMQPGDIQPFERDALYGMLFGGQAL